MASFSLGSLPRGLAVVATALMHAGLAVAGFVLMVGVMFVALTLGALLIVWALAKGRRRGPIRFGSQHFRAARPFSSTRRRGQGDDVVDVEAREVSAWKQR